MFIFPVIRGKVIDVASSKFYLFSSADSMTSQDGRVV